jgi:hypothetical protein
MTFEFLHLITCQQQPMNFWTFIQCSKNITSQWIDGKMEDVHSVIIVIESLQQYSQANNDVL